LYLSGVQSAFDELAQAVLQCWPSALDLSEGSFRQLVLAQHDEAGGTL
jgi:hypothetical protein